MCDFLEIPGAIAGGYLIGSIPFGYLLVKLKLGRDVREQGSGVIGATNVSRVLGKKVGVLVASLDVLKGILAFYLAAVLLKTNGAAEIAAVSAVIGHCFPVWIGFRGGKGVSTAFGATIMIATIPAIIAFAVFAISILIAKRVSAASLNAVWSFAGISFLLDVQIWAKIMSILLALFITFTHRQNIARIFAGEEKTILGDK